MPKRYNWNRDSDLRYLNHELEDIWAAIHERTTVQESDGSPLVQGVIKIKFDQDDGFTVTDDGNGTVTIGYTAPP